MRWVLLTGVVALSILTVPANAASRDGTWSVSINPASGKDCTRGLPRYPITVRDGRISTGGRLANIHGKVAGNGTTSVTVAAKGFNATGWGQLGQTSGSGKFRLTAKGQCSGTWSADKMSYSITITWGAIA